MLKKLSTLANKPALYEKGTSEYTQIWTDEHISKGMLEAHLHPDWDAATRNHKTVKEIVKWIATITPADKYSDLLDLGCGPGIYTELFHKEGYQVSGIDLSKRSINYAQDSAKKKNLYIKYYLQDYLTMEFMEQFDVITFLYFDYGVLAPGNREKLLVKIYNALKPGGVLIIDICTELFYKDSIERTSWEFYNDGGFFDNNSHLLLSSLFLYDNNRTRCEQSIVISEQDIKSYNCWQHTFTKDELNQEFKNAGLSINGFHGITGSDYINNLKEMCVVAHKRKK